MRNVNLVLLTIFMALFATEIASAQINRFEGRWKNIEPSNEGITSIVITYKGVRVSVHVWGRCAPNDCDWGEAKAYAYGNNAMSNVVTSADTLTATYRASFKEAILLIRPAAWERIQVESFIHFTDKSGRTAYHERNYFVRARAKSGVADCLPYNPHNLRIVKEGSTGWLLTDGVSRMKTLYNRRDAERALALAQMHTAQCFIGRDNARKNRDDFVVGYWTGASGIPAMIDDEDCVSYDPQNLRIVDEGANGWLLTDGRFRMLMLADREDAERALDMARRHSRQCFIGRDSTNLNRQGHVIRYWR